MCRACGKDAIRSEDRGVVRLRVAADDVVCVCVCVHNSWCHSVDVCVVPFSSARRVKKNPGLSSEAKKTAL